jgi:hypothetical protein
MGHDMQHRAVQSACCLAMLFTVSGCGTRPVSGGTPGVLTTDGNPIPDVQLTVYPAGSGQCEGSAVTRSDGTFELVTPGASGPLELDAGSYVVTLESVGAPTDLPPQYLDRDSSPLKVDWADGARLELSVPGLKLK